MGRRRPIVYRFVNRSSPLGPEEVELGMIRMVDIFQLRTWWLVGPVCYSPINVLDRQTR